ncbi:phosphonate ABC transporter ATP-binding protein [Evansella halocellulosilytica]|uniref:phosphonate ABC transporter ATP-binding protein n=1 Tax=Evansella halocellulosilytica TaxID=2011013 RepID=UPI000BB7E9B1|nr:phosphonate ABC transporter ATP-binding protein [Evansella halocellulosilytica]
MITLDRVSVKYTKTADYALKNVNVTFEKGEFICIVGRSGAGKSTLLRTLNGLQPLSSGEVYVDEMKIHQLNQKDQRRLRSNIGMIFQHFHLIPRLTVRHNVLTGYFGKKKAYENLLGLFSAEEKEKADHYIKEVHLAKFADRKVEHLSGGQKQRVGIARALMQEPMVFLADEPVASLDPSTAKEIFRLLQMIHIDKGLLTIANVHDVELAKEFATRMIGLKNGQIIFDGNPSHFDNDVYRRIYA